MKESNMSTNYTPHPRQVRDPTFRCHIKGKREATDATAGTQNADGSP